LTWPGFSGIFQPDSRIRGIGDSGFPGRCRTSTTQRALSAHRMGGRRRHARRGSDGARHAGLVLSRDIGRDGLGYGLDAERLRQYRARGIGRLPDWFTSYQEEF